jgi:hypothetical protein
MTNRREAERQIEWHKALKDLDMTLSVYRPDGRPRYQVQHLQGGQIYATWPPHGHTRSIAEISAYLDGLEFGS